MHATFLQRWSGRNFSNSVEKGKNDPKERATLTLEDFLFWLVRWIVDIYHDRPHAGLDYLKPREARNLAMAEHRPRRLTSREMRVHFGDIVVRKVT